MLQKGLVLGVYHCPETNEYKLTPAACKFNSQVGGKLEDLIRDGRPLSWPGSVTVFHHLDPEYNVVAVAGLGPANATFDPLEQLDVCKENVRMAAAAGARAVRREGVQLVRIENLGSAECAAEGATLGLWRYQDCKNKSQRAVMPEIELYDDPDSADPWRRGIYKADAQNLARKLSDIPANLLTPAMFAQFTIEALCPCNVGVEVHDREWLEYHKFRLFMHVAKGSCEPPVLISLTYCGGHPEEAPTVICASGVTFDSGGLCLKPCKGMDRFRGDMAGAAIAVAVVRAAASMSLPLNINALIPCAENMPSGMSMRPGDIVLGMNNKSVRIDDTDNEGRLLLADALVYAYTQHRPRLIIDIGTLTYGMRAALGGAASGVFTNVDELWHEVRKAGSITGDRVWRFPLWNYFTKKVTNITNADVTNVGHGPGGGPCRAAAFLKEFLLCGEWMHFDIASCGMVEESQEVPYLAMHRMTGRPTRTIIQLLYQIACPGGNE